MCARIILSRTFERDMGGFDHREIPCKLIDTPKWGPLAYAMNNVVVFTGFEKMKVVIEAHDEVELTEGELSDARKILARINKAYS